MRDRGVDRGTPSGTTWHDINNHGGAAGAEEARGRKDNIFCLFLICFFAF